MSSTYFLALLFFLLGLGWLSLLALIYKRASLYLSTSVISLAARRAESTKYMAYFSSRPAGFLVELIECIASNISCV